MYWVGPENCKMMMKVIKEDLDMLIKEKKTPK